MNGKTDEEIRSRRKELELQVADKVGKDVIILNTLFESPPISGLNSDIWYLGKSLQVLAEADLVVMDKGWSRARGCKIEEITAKEYGIDRIYIL